jgi:hypothetical protein
MTAELPRTAPQFADCQIFGLTYAETAILRTVSSTFTETQIYPTDPNVFDNADFLAPETTEWPITSALHQLDTSLGDHPIA